MGVGKFVVLAALVVATQGLQNGLGRTPPMGWLSWERYRCEIDCTNFPNECISEDLYKRQADAMVKNGFLAAGYEYVNVDDCWSEMKRDSNGKLVADKKRFPSGIKALADYMHQRGLKLGIYSDAGTNTCGGYPGSGGHFDIDAQTFAEWEVDSLKLDGCYMDTNSMADIYPQMTTSLNKTGRPILYSCSWPAYQIGQNPDYWKIEKYCNIWRNFDDIGDSWDSVASIIDFYDANKDAMVPVTRPGSFNDPDMLIIGDYGLSYDQSKTQMALWAIYAAPLYISSDLTNIRPELREILINKDIIAINQDKNAIMGNVFKNISSSMHVYRRPVGPTVGEDYSYAVAFVNRDSNGGPATVTVKSEDMGLFSYEVTYVLTDLYDNNKEVARLNAGDKFTVTVNPTGVQMFKATAIPRAM